MCHIETTAPEQASEAVAELYRRQARRGSVLTGLVIHRLGIVIEKIEAGTGQAAADNTGIETGIDDGHGVGGSLKGASGVDGRGQKQGNNFIHGYGFHANWTGPGDPESD